MKEVWLLIRTDAEGSVVLTTHPTSQKALTVMELAEMTERDPEATYGVRCVPYFP